MTEEKGKAPAFQFYASDFVDDTMEWSPTEVGIYMRLLCFEWINKSLPVEQEKLIRLAGCDGVVFNAAWETIKIKFNKNGDGRLFNIKLEKIRKKQDDYRAMKSKAGKISGYNRSKRTEH
jgi:uncharacterized protein YdaU (DUF1376 family)